MSDLDVLKEIPGYKAILKSVLKSQIQLLMEQLSEHAGEESIILTASVNDGSLSHLGSSTGKGFFEGRDEIKSQFLGYCLKTYHKQKTREPPKPYQRKHPSPRTSPSTQPAKRPCVYPVSLSQYSSETYPSSNIETHRLPERRTSQEQTDSTMDLAVGTSGDSSSDTIVKTELNDQNTSNSGPTAVTSAAEFLPSSIHLSHTQGSSETNEGADNENTKNDSSDETRIKVEQLEDELEITGVEMAAGSINHWGQGQPGYIPESDSSYSMPSDQSGYNKYHFGYKRSEMPTCPVCGKMFSFKQNLKTHMKIHSGEKKFVCHKCNKAFRLKHHLQGHLMTHMNEANSQQ